jgi:catechol 2,3-dioxygenase-like lactoylglutathione lyase family enzyme
LVERPTWSSRAAINLQLALAAGGNHVWVSHRLNRIARGEDQMTVELNHTIIPAKDKWASAKFLADILGLEAGPEWSHFVPVRTANGVTLDFAEASEFRRQHYAFLLSEQEFDAALSRIKSADIAYYADFNRDGRGQINQLYGGRGVYFEDPDGHLLELITRPYGPKPERWTAAQS